MQSLDSLRCSCMHQFIIDITGSSLNKEEILILDLYLQLLTRYMYKNNNVIIPLMYMSCMHGLSYSVDPVYLSLLILYVHVCTPSIEATLCIIIMH